MHETTTGHNANIVHVEKTRRRKEAHSVHKLHGHLVAMAAEERLEHRRSRFPHLLLRALLLEGQLQVALVLELPLPTASRCQRVLPPLGFDGVELVRWEVFSTQLILLAECRRPCTLAREHCRDFLTRR